MRDALKLSVLKALRNRVGQSRYAKISYVSLVYILDFISLGIEFGFFFSLFLSSVSLGLYGKKVFIATLIPVYAYFLYSLFMFRLTSHAQILYDANFLSSFIAMTCLEMLLFCILLKRMIF